MGRRSSTTIKVYTGYKKEDVQAYAKIEGVE
jgi:hypothetical protein